MRIYSNAWIDKETGDLNGFELAIKDTGEDKIDSLLYVYEGTLAEGIPLAGGLSNGSVEIKGDWVEHLIQYPDKKEIIQTHAVKINGTLKPASFNGRISIKDNIDVDTEVRLRRVRHIWACKP